MATGSVVDSTIAKSSAKAGTSDIGRLLWLALRAVGSLKITVAMFALGTLILLVGTLAQDEETIVDVKKAYFNSWVATVPLDVFVPQTIWPHTEMIPYAFAIPGGAAVGLILLVNLIAAKLTRFQMNAKGGRFAIGLGVTIVGFLLVSAIVVSAHLGDGLQGEPPFDYEYLWMGIKGTVFLLAGGSLMWSIGWIPKTRVLRWTLWTLTAIFIGLSVFLLATNDAYRIPNPGLRIVWQLTKSLVVSLVLLIGLVLLFGKNGGNVLIHLGVGLLMLGQFIFGDAQREERISIFEGQRTVVAYEQDTVELAFIDSSGEESNRVIAFDHPLLQASAAKGKFLSSAELPFEFRVDRWMTNSKRAQRTRPPREGDEDFGLVGLAQQWAFTETPKSGGAKSQVNFATAYITVRNKVDQTDVGSFAVSQWLNDDAIMYKPEYEKANIDDKDWTFGLRFRRNYKPYSVTLDDVVLEQYTGTAKPKDYSSWVKVTDAEGSTLQKGRIWMNNPMRFRGETFYQSGYMGPDDNPYGVEQTTLQVVTNAGWLIPYVACVLSGLGMLVHFGGTFARFASRYDRNAFAEKVDKKENGSSRLYVIVPLLIVGAFEIWAGMKALKPTSERDEIDWYAVGEIPTQFGGRIKPLSSSSAEVLEILSNKKFALSKEGHVYEPVHKTGKKIDSLKWIMAVFAREKWVLDSPLIRIDAVEVTSALELKRHQSNRYSYNEILEGLDKASAQVQKVFQTKREDWTFEQQKLADVLEKIITLENLFDAYSPQAPAISDSPAEMRASIATLQRKVDSIRSRSPLAIIPPLVSPTLQPGEKAPPAKWEGFGTALFEIVKMRSLGLDSKKESVLSCLSMIEAFSTNSKDGAEINKLVREFKSNVNEEFGATIRTNKVGLENWFEHFDPFSIASTLYVFVGIFAFASFAFMRVPLRRTAFWLCVLALAIHTLAIVCRIVISERPPVVTLYSAAVFIGWAMVLFCTVTELLFPISVSVLLASVAGFLTLQVAFGLDVGDSMPVLEAVLDTQFWLSTHVVSVSLGYSATFVAGFLGIGIIAAKWIAQLAGQQSEIGQSTTNAIPTLYRICYGVVCFGLFFSFVGTVLGGLWGDDSWGRFWGWDPKENGAMMIVLWNALLLHARWDKMIGSLGFAILAVVGNIITAWSMFGTNLLGVGLHSYGFSKETFYYLVYFAISQLVAIALGLIILFVLRGQQKSEFE